MTKKNDAATLALVALSAFAFLVSTERDARADDATVSVGDRDRFAEPPESRPQRAASAPLVADDAPRPSDFRDPRRSPFRLQLGPSGITTGKGFGVGVGIGADFGTGSVGGRLSAAWLRGEGRGDDGASTPTGTAVGLYAGEITLDLHKRGPIHPIVGMGAGVLYVSRPDASGFAGMGTGRLALEYALGLDDADVRVGASFGGGLVGPVDSDVKDLRGYALVGAHLAIGF